MCTNPTLTRPTTSHFHPPARPRNSSPPLSKSSYARPARSSLREHRSFPKEQQIWVTKRAGVLPSNLKERPWKPPKIFLCSKEYSKT